MDRRVNVKHVGSLFLISYSDVSSAHVDQLHEYRVHLYIDIPTIDYYTDELTETKLSKLNKKFKLSKLKSDIWKAFYNNNDQFWDNLLQSDHYIRVIVNIASSGSLRYVQTIKFLLETMYEQLKVMEKNVRCEFHLDSTPTSLKWFKTFLDHELLNSGVIHFNTVNTAAYNNANDDNNANNDIAVPRGNTPFKDYYMKLNQKFVSPQDSHVMESIVIITNHTGVKALLTILSDRPLNSYISEESMKALHQMHSTTTRNRSYSATVPTHAYDSEFISHTPLKRESSSILNFQNEVITSNKDKAVKIKLPSSLTTSPTLTQSRSFTPIEFPTDEHTKHMVSVFVSAEEDNYTSMEQDDDMNGANDCEGDNNDNEEVYNNEDDEYEEEEEDDEDEDDDDDDDEGLSFFAPNILSRSGSGFNLSSKAHNSINNNLKLPGTRKGRFRSLSLMDPALNGPFKQSGQRSPNPGVVSGSNNLSVKEKPEFRCASPLASTVTTLDEENETNEDNDQEESLDHALHNKFTNIYIHDGDFDDVSMDDTTQQRMLYNKKKLMKIHGQDTNSNVINTNTLIPPEFYSRLSSPSSSASSSNTSLTQLDTLVTPTFTKWLNNNSTLTNYHDSQTHISGGTNLFEKKLIKKSMEDMRRQPAMDFISGLINGDIDSTEKNTFALNFHNARSPQHLQALDDEDRMMSGYSALPDNDSVTGLASESGTTSCSEDETTTTASISTIKLGGPSTGGVSEKGFTFNSNSNNNTANVNASFKASTDKITPSFSFQLYDDIESINDHVDSQINNNEPKPKEPKSYKKAVSIDLYGDEDVDNNDAWFLGWNNK